MEKPTNDKSLSPEDHKREIAYHMRMLNGGKSPAFALYMSWGMLILTMIVLGGFLLWRVFIR